MEDHAAAVIQEIGCLTEQRKLFRRCAPGLPAVSGCALVDMISAVGGSEAAEK
jgi:hypothetical protein